MFEAIIYNSNSQKQKVDLSKFLTDGKFLTIGTNDMDLRKFDVGVNVPIKDGDSSARKFVWDWSVFYDDVFGVESSLDVHAVYTITDVYVETSRIRSERGCDLDTLVIACSRFGKPEQKRCLRLIVAKDECITFSIRHHEL